MQSYSNSVFPISVNIHLLHRIPFQPNFGIPPSYICSYSHGGWPESVKYPLIECVLSNDCPCYVLNLKFILSPQLYRPIFDFPAFHDKDIVESYPPNNPYIDHIFWFLLSLWTTSAVNWVTKFRIWFRDEFFQNLSCKKQTWFPPISWHGNNIAVDPATLGESTHKVPSIPKLRI